MVSKNAKKKSRWIKVSKSLQNLPPYLAYALGVVVVTLVLFGIAESINFIDGAADSTSDGQAGWWMLLPLTPFLWIVWISAAVWLVVGVTQAFTRALILYFKDN